MKTHTIGFKSQITELGRQLKGTITYGNTTLENEIYSITPHYEADILKSVMKQLDLELSVSIPINTIINCQIGILVNNNYEMLNFGNYVVYNSEKQEDTNTYKITCYDKLLYSMKQNENLNITYPITIKNYLNAIGNKIGLNVANTTFYNQDMQIPSELYLGQEYTYRDILDEIAQATGSIICLNENDEIIVKYPTVTNDTIDEDFLKDVNVDFGQRYGPVNSIVLSRAGESDNVYLRNEQSILQNGLTEIKIVDNQIMNFNNRSDYLQGLLNALNGLYYYLNDFTSTGILYYDVGDLYNIQVGENTYQCLMLNDEINVTTGIEEIIHTDMPEQSETDYSKADKTDRRINQTYLIVDKQNQEIEAVVKQTVDPTNPESTVNKVSRLNIRVGELESSIKDIADITTYGESDRAEVELTDINKSEPIMIKVHPTSTNISYLYPRDGLYPSDTQYMPNRIIRFTRTYEEDGTTKTQNIDYTLPDDLLRYSDTVYDEFYLDYDSHTCQVIKRCQYNADGTVRALGTEITTDYPYPTIVLGEGNYTITLLGYDFGYIYVRLMAKNIYTTQFYTKVETDSQIAQSARDITMTVSETYERKDDALTNYTEFRQTATSLQTQVNNNNQNISTLTQTATSLQSQITSNDGDISTLNQTVNGVSIEVGKKYNTSDFTNAKITQKLNDQSSNVQISPSKISLAGKTIQMTSDNIAINSNNFSVTKEGRITATSGNIGGFEMNNVKFSKSLNGLYKYNNYDLYMAAAIVMNWINLPYTFEDLCDINNDSQINSSDFVLIRRAILGTYENTKNVTGTFEINSNDPKKCISVKKDGQIAVSIGVGGIDTASLITSSIICGNAGGTVASFNGIVMDAETATIRLKESGDTGSETTITPTGITTPQVTQTSLEENKKNFEKFENALNIIKNIDIYKYNLKNEKDDIKKHIGFVIGDNFKYSQDVTSQENDGVDVYSFVSLCCKAIQEQQEQIEKLQKEIKEMKGEK